MQDLYESTDPVQVRCVANRMRKNRIQQLVEHFDAQGDVIYSTIGQPLPPADEGNQTAHVFEFVIDFTDGEGFRKSMDGLVSAGVFEWQALPPYSGEI